jgi:hypothetical protein
LTGADIGDAAQRAAHRKKALRTRITGPDSALACTRGHMRAPAPPRDFPRCANERTRIAAA